MARPTPRFTPSKAAFAQRNALPITPGPSCSEPDPATVPSWLRYTDRVLIASAPPSHPSSALVASRTPSKSSCAHLCRISRFSFTTLLRGSGTSGAKRGSTILIAEAYTSGPQSRSGLAIVSQTSCCSSRSSSDICCKASAACRAGRKISKLSRISANSVSSALLRASSLCVVSCNSPISIPSAFLALKSFLPSIRIVSF